MRNLLLYLTLASFLVSAFGRACDACHGDTILHAHLLQLMAEKQARKDGTPSPSDSKEKSNSTVASKGGLDDGFWKSNNAEPADTGRSPGGRFVVP